MFLRVNFKYAHATQEGVVDSSIEIKAEQIKCHSQVGRRRFSWRRRAIVSSPVTRHTVTLHCHLDLDATNTQRRLLEASAAAEKHSHFPLPRLVMKVVGLMIAFARGGKRKSPEVLVRPLSSVVRPFASAGPFASDCEFTHLFSPM